MNLLKVETLMKLDPLFCQLALAFTDAWPTRSSIDAFHRPSSSNTTPCMQVPDCSPSVPRLGQQLEGIHPI